MKLVCYETPTVSNATLSDVYAVLCYVFVAASMIYTDDLLYSKGSSRKGYDFVYTSQSDYFIQHMHVLCHGKVYYLQITFASQLLQGSKAHFIALRYNFNKSR